MLLDGGNLFKVINMLVVSRHLCCVIYTTNFFNVSLVFVLMNTVPFYKNNNLRCIRNEGFIFYIPFQGQTEKGNICVLLSDSGNFLYMKFLFNALYFSLVIYRPSRE